MVLALLSAPVLRIGITRSACHALLQECVRSTDALRPRLSSIFSLLYRHASADGGFACLDDRRTCVTSRARLLDGSLCPGWSSEQRLCRNRCVSTFRSWLSTYLYKKITYNFLTLLIPQ